MWELEVFGDTQRRYASELANIRLSTVDEAQASDSELQTAILKLADPTSLALTRSPIPVFI